jgi:hypothetical protein
LGQTPNISIESIKVDQFQISKVQIPREGERERGREGEERGERERE